MLTIFCYGSNLPKRRLSNRIGQVMHLGNALLHGYSLGFNKKSKDGSGKANINFVDKSEDFVWGIVIQITEVQKEKLDRFEGKGKGYSEQEVEVILQNGTKIEALTYVADTDWLDSSLKPFDWYKALIIFGLMENQVPINYLMKIKNFECTPDTNIERSDENWSIIKSSLIANENPQ
ncbi:MAG: gamma-glutamylcyclotransferase family protein [Saprospiraceae bacterium]|nr:gamma-glutamylcyclotransferase family protein [Saprospiraceae bacterium]